MEESSLRTLKRNLVTEAAKFKWNLNDYDITEFYNITIK